MGKHRYGVVLDAGSSGSRVYVYRFKKAEYVRQKGHEKQLDRLPEVKTKKGWNMKVKPGISTYGVKPERVGPEHLRDLVLFAEDVVPKSQWSETPIFLLATAGMRLLPDDQRNAVLEQTCSYFREYSSFQLPGCDLHVQVISGETEGLYGWLAANYLLGGFDAPDKHDHGKGHHTYGFLDMGGASAQIAFAPNATESEKHANDLNLLRLRKVNGEQMEYGVFVTTWLGFGANEARKKYVNHLIEASPGVKELPDPCLPTGLLVTHTGYELTPQNASVQPHLIGTGQFPECLRSTYPLLEKNKACDDPPCLLNGVHTPAIDFDVNHFVGVSEYWHTTHEVFAMAHKDKAYDLQTYQKQVTAFCSRYWTEIVDDVEEEKWGSKVNEKTVEEVCFKASWLINMLHDGIGVPRVGIEHVNDSVSNHDNKTDAIVENAKDRGFLDPFQAVDKIDGTELSWTLGKMLLYASSQMPPTNDSLPVGFGSNVAGSKLPSDFQHQTGHPSPPPSSSDSDSMQSTGTDLDWHDRILGSSYSRRVPGIIIFLLILALAAYLLCGRERRLKLSHKLHTLTGRKSSPSRSKRRSGFLGSKLFGGSGASEPSYERVLESADPYDLEQNDFELADVLSDSSSTDLAPSRTGRSSGWATPAATASRGLSPDVSRSSPKNKGYFDGAAGASGGAGFGLGITPFERGGLSVRTESKERLFPGKERGRSRAGSPRRSQLVSPFKENVD